MTGWGASDQQGCKPRVSRVLVLGGAWNSGRCPHLEQGRLQNKPWEGEGEHTLSFPAAFWLESPTVRARNCWSLAVCPVGLPLRETASCYITVGSAQPLLKRKIQDYNSQYGKKKKLNSQNSTCPNHSAAFSHLFLRVCVCAVHKRHVMSICPWTHHVHLSMNITSGCW